MKFFTKLCLAGLFVLALVLNAHPSYAATCTPTGFIRDGIDMTAAMINPPGTVSGDVDATGCNIGVYYDQNGAVNGANIFGANYFGVLVNGDVNTVSVDVLNSTIHDIGENPLNGLQHGVAIYYRSLGTGTTAGNIIGNTISQYQKGGIVANGAATVTIKQNSVTGQGRVDYIGQNGIQVGYGAKAQVLNNTVTGNAYEGSSTSSAGILVVGGEGYGAGFAYTTGTQIAGNTLVNNDVGVYLSNATADWLAPATPTNIKVVNNVISNDGVTNGYPYQAGISDMGNGDKLINNTITGVGYTPGTDYIYAIDADPSYAPGTKVHANVIP